MSHGCRLLVRNVTITSGIWTSFHVHGIDHFMRFHVDVDLLRALLQMK